MPDLLIVRQLSFAPMNYEAHYNLAVLLRHLKYYKESLEELEKATTLVTSGNNAAARQRYIFDVMNDVTRTILANTDSNLVEKLSDEPVKSPKVTYVNGKLF